MNRLGSCLLVTSTSQRRTFEIEIRFGNKVKLELEFKSKLDFKPAAATWWIALYSSRLMVTSTSQRTSEIEIGIEMEFNWNWNLLSSCLLVTSASQMISEIEIIVGFGNKNWNWNWNRKLISNFNRGGPLDRRCIHRRYLWAEGQIDRRANRPKVTGLGLRLLKFGVGVRVIRTRSDNFGL